MLLITIRMWLFLATRKYPENLSTNNPYEKVLLMRMFCFDNGYITFSKVENRKVYP